MIRFPLTLLLGALTYGPAAGAQAPPPPSDTVRYTVLMAGRPAGVERSWRAADGALGYYFTFNDRGRGSELTERIVLGPGSVPALIETTGHDYFKNPVAERFSLDGSRATWRNTAEQGSKPVSGRGPAFYVTLDGAPEEAALLARAPSGVAIGAGPFPSQVGSGEAAAPTRHD